jgi:hypothetical protein
MAINITKKSPYSKIRRDDLLVSHKTLLELVEDLHIKQLIVDSEGSVFIYYKDTEYGPIQVIGD